MEHYKGVVKHEDFLRYTSPVMEFDKYIGPTLGNELVRLLWVLGQNPLVLLARLSPDGRKVAA